MFKLLSLGLQWRQPLNLASFCVFALRVHKLTLSLAQCLLAAHQYFTTQTNQYTPPPPLHTHSTDLPMIYTPLYGDGLMLPSQSGLVPDSE